MSQTKNKITQLRANFNKLNLAIQNPKFYVANQISDLNFLVDIECERFITTLNIGTQTTAEHSEALERQSMFIYHIESFGKSCLSS